MAKVVQMAEQIDLDLSELRQLKTDVVQQPNSAQSALQLKSRVLLGPDDMHMRRPVIVRKDHDSPAPELGKDRWHCP